MRTIIETSGLTKRYGGHTAVDHVDLSMPEGGVYGFIGPNGAGKSTTMKLLLGLIHPTEGEITLLGEPLGERNRLALLRQTGSLIETPSSYGHLTGEENCRVLCDLKGVPYRDIGRVLDIVQLTQDKGKKVKQYSLGMRQRLGIAQALLGEPKLLILDEPTNGLDPAGIQEMRELIRTMPQRCGASVLISSHLLSELEQIVDLVGIIREGRLLFQGGLEELQTHSRGGIVLRTLHPQQTERVLKEEGVPFEREAGAHVLPALKDAVLARLVQTVAVRNAGVIGVEQKTKSLEEIFLSLTGNREEGTTHAADSTC
ncbi:MAG: ABC transporter ATP-binding protein [Eubacteriales bacterium]|nr:ABC transporter ATP-binding protein [Eubacteriales bacterium]